MYDEENLPSGTENKRRLLLASVRLVVPSEERTRSVTKNNQYCLIHTAMTSRQRERSTGLLSMNRKNIVSLVVNRAKRSSHSILGNARHWYSVPDCFPIWGESIGIEIQWRMKDFLLI